MKADGAYAVTASVTETSTVSAHGIGTTSHTKVRSVQCSHYSLFFIGTSAGFFLDRTFVEGTRIPAVAERLRDAGVPVEIL